MPVPTPKERKRETSYRVALFVRTGSIMGARFQDAMCAKPNTIRDVFRNGSHIAEARAMM